jgi:hypothetical protein
VFAKGEVDTSTSNSGYPDLDKLLKDELEQLELKKWILNIIKERICKNNVLVVHKIVNKTSKKA